MSDCMRTFSLATNSTMAGKPYKVGRYAHTLRMRLMREHVGIDVDAIEEDQLMSRDPVAQEDHLKKWDPDHEQAEGENNIPGRTNVKHTHARDRLMTTLESGVGAGKSQFHVRILAGTILNSAANSH
jgi:phospholipase D1/2